MPRRPPRAPAARPVTRRHFLGWAAGSAWALAACGGPAASAPPTAAPAGVQPASGAAPAAAQAAPTARPLERIRFVYVAQSAIFGPAWVAKEAGYFEKYGLDAELSNIPGATRLQQAILAGEVDYAILAGTSAVAATISGAPSPLLAEFIDLPVWYLIVRPEISRIEDLRGRRVGITQFGSGTDYVMRKALRAWGMEPDRDVTILQMGGTQEIFAGLAGGAIDAGPMASPLHLRAQSQGYPPLLDLADTGIHYPQMVLTATRAYLQGRDAQAANVIRALVEATRRYKTDNALALELLARYSGDTDPTQLQTAWQSAVKLLKDVPVVSEDGVRGVLDDLATSRPEARTARLEDIIEARYLRELEAEGFFARLASGS